MSHQVLEVSNLSCARGDRPLFAGLSFALAAGQLLHVVGSNGSGKTTLLRTLCGLSRPAAGEIRWRGAPVARLGDEYRAQLAYVGHQDSVQGELTPAENLHLTCLAANLDAAAVDRALTRLGVSAFRGFPRKLSQGQRRRAALARLCFFSRAPLWLLDEPYTALDASSCRIMDALLQEHRASGGIVVLSSHQELSLPSAQIARLDLDVHSGTDISAPSGAPARAALAAYNPP